MAGPITGPIYENISLPGYRLYRERYRQKRPYTTPLLYNMRTCRGQEISSWYERTGLPQSGGGTIGVSNWMPDLVSAYAGKRANALNRAYDKLVGELSEKSGWLENLAQIGKTRMMFVQRAVQLGRFASKLKKFDFKGAAKVLKTPVPSKVSRRKAASQNFLEYEYGLKPLISDLQNSLSILTSFPDVLVPIEGKATEFYRDIFKNLVSGPRTNSYEQRVTAIDIRVKMGCYIEVTNPNVFLANQLGILDLALPWKLIPFSFVVDWFVNVEQVISSLSDWYGVNVITPYSVEVSKGSYQSTNVGIVVNGGGTTDRSWNVSQIQRAMIMTRGTAIPKPTLRIRSFKGFSIERGAQAISLVLSVLGK